MMRWLTVIVILIASGQSIAVDLAKSCRLMALHEQEVAVTVDKPSLLILHNRSDTQLWITHATASTGAGAGWSSALAPRHWSALFMSPAKDAFHLACVESSPGHEQHTSCAEVIDVCIQPTAVLPTDASGTFWAVENVKKSSMLPQLQQRGFQWPADEE
ncbi:MAG: hypothetical protein JJT82_09325 [Legionellaceae bacterium]|nr:hypothetical protein [Legionellaceae bacterium]